MCKLAIDCVNFGVNFILLKFCLCKKNDKYEVWLVSSVFYDIPKSDSLSISLIYGFLRLY